MNKITLQSTPKIQSNNQVGNLFINPRYTEDIYILVRNPSGGYFARTLVQVGTGTTPKTKCPLQLKVWNA